MHGDYEDRYIPALLDAIAAVQPFEEARSIGSIENASAKQPNIAAFIELAPGRFVGTTCGISALPAPLPLEAGFENFELIALTTDHDPRLLWLLSNMAAYMLSAMSPYFYGDDATMTAILGSGRTLEEAAETFLPYQTIRGEDDEQRFLLAPRFQFQVPMGPPVEAVELLPLTAKDWAEVEPLELSERAEWVRSLGEASATRWSALLDVIRGGQFPPRSN